MDSSKMSIKEGFDFLFEEDKVDTSSEEKSSLKTKIKGTKEDLKIIPNTPEGNVVSLLLGDMVFSAIKGLDEPLLMRISNSDTRKEAGEGVNWIEGSTLNLLRIRTAAQIKSSSKSDDRENKRSANWNRILKLYEIDQSSVGSGFEVVKSLAFKYAQAVNILTNLGANRLMLSEAKQNVIRISGAKYRTIYDKIQSIHLRRAEKTGHLNIRITPMAKLLIDNINSLIKTGTFEKDKISDKEDFKLGDNEQVAAKVSAYFKTYLKDYLNPQKMSRPQDRKRFESLTGDDLTKAIANRKYRFYTNHFGSATNYNKMIVAISQNKFDLAKFILRCLNYRKGSSNIVDSKIKGLYNVLFNGELSDQSVTQIFEIASAYAKVVMGRGKDSIVPEDSDTEYKGAHDKITQILNSEGQTTTGESIKDISQEEAESTLIDVDTPAPMATEDSVSIGGTTSSSGDATEDSQSDDDSATSKKSSGVFVQVFAEIESDQNIEIKDLGFGKEVEVEFNPKITISTQEGNQEISRLIVREYSGSQPDIDFVLACYNDEDLGRNNDNYISQRISRGDLLSYENIPDNLVAKINEAFPDEAASQEDTKIDADKEAEETSEKPKYVIQTPLSEVRSGDYDNFLRHYVAICAYIDFYVESSEAYKFITESTGKKLKAVELISILNKHVKSIDESSAIFSKDNLDKSITNLEKFANTNVDGILFEEVNSQKYFIKINGQSFEFASLLMNTAMRRSPNDVFRYISSFIVPEYALTDNSGKPCFSTINNALDYFATIDESKKSVELSKSGESDRLGQLVFKIEGEEVFKFTSDFNFILSSKSAGESDLPGMFKSFSSEWMNAALNRIDLVVSFKLDENGGETFINFINSCRGEQRDAMTDVLVDEGVDESKAKEVADTLVGGPQPEKEQKQSLSSKPDTKPAKKKVASIEELLNHKDIKTLANKIYTNQNSLTYAISSLSNAQILDIQSKNQDEINKVKAMLITMLDPNLTAIKSEIRNLCADGSEIRGVFDATFASKRFNEAAFKGAYGALIVSAVDKIVRGKSARVTEGIISGLKDWAQKATSLAKATIGNIGTPLAIMQSITFGLNYFGYGAAITAAAPWLLGIGACFVAKGLYDARKWAKEAEKYKDNPIKYIEGLLDDKNAKKTAKGLINTAASDIVLKAIDPTFKSAASAGFENFAGGQSEYSKEIENLSQEFQSLSDEQKTQAKDLNDYVLTQMSSAQYYKKGIVSDSVLNIVFNGVLFGENRVSETCRSELLSGNFNLENSSHKEELMTSVANAIKNSAVKNNFTDYIENYARRNMRKGATTFGSEKEIADRNNKTFYGLRKSAFISNDQINEKYLDELMQEITGMTREEFNLDTLKSDKDQRRKEFGESILIGSLANLLFEDYNVLLEDDAKQKEHDREVDAAVASSSLIGTSWAENALNMVKMKKLSIGGSTIFKDIVAFDNTPASTTGAPGLFGYKITAALPKIVDTVYRNPLEAKAAAAVGADAMGPQFYLPSGEFVQTFYSNAPSVVGTPKALSFMIGKTAGSAKFIGKLRTAEKLKWIEEFKSQGLNVDVKTGVVSADPAKGCLEIPSSDPFFKLNLDVVETSLEGSAKKAVTHYIQYTAYNKYTSTLSTDVDYGQQIAKSLIEDISGRALLGEDPQIPPAFKAFAQEIQRSTTNKQSIDFAMQQGELGDLSDFDINQAGEQIRQGLTEVEKGLKDLTREMNEKIQLHKDYIELRDVGDVISGGSSDPTPELSDQFEFSEIRQEYLTKAMKLLNEKIFDVKVEKSKITLKKVISSLNNDEAHQGLNLQYKPTIEGGIGLEKGTTVPAEKTFVSKVKVFQGETESNISVDVAEFDFEAALGKGLIYSLIPIKIMTSFAQRGLQGSKFADLFYKIFNPQQVFYVDMLTALIGQPIGVISPSKEDDASKDDDDNQVIYYPAMRVSHEDAARYHEGEITIDDLMQLSQLVQPSPKKSDESFVYQTNMSSYLFENKTITKKKKVSRLGNEQLINEIATHKNLQDMFKNMF